MLSLQLPSALKHPLTKWALRDSRDKISKGIIFWASEKKCTKIGSVKNSNSNWWYKTVPLDFSLFVASKFAQVILFLAFHFFVYTHWNIFYSAIQKRRRTTKTKDQSSNVFRQEVSIIFFDFFKIYKNIDFDRVIRVFLWQFCLSKWTSNNLKL